MYNSSTTFSTPLSCCPPFARSLAACPTPIRRHHPRALLFLCDGMMHATDPGRIFVRVQLLLRYRTADGYRRFLVGVSPARPSLSNARLPSGAVYYSATSTHIT